MSSPAYTAGAVRIALGRSTSSPCVWRRLERSTSAFEQYGGARPDGHGIQDSGRRLDVREQGL